MSQSRCARISLHFGWHSGSCRGPSHADAAVLPVRHSHHGLRGRWLSGQLIDWAKETFRYQVEVVERNEQRWFRVLPKR
jgi:hypothetical protein